MQPAGPLVIVISVYQELHPLILSYKCNIDRSKYMYRTYNAQ